MVVDEGDKQRVWAVSRFSKFLKAFGDPARGSPAANDAVDRVIERKIEERIETAVGCKTAEQLIVGVVHFAEHEEVRFAEGGSVLAHGAEPAGPEIAFDVADSVHAKAVAVGLFDELFERISESGADFGEFSFEIVQRVELANDRLDGIVPIAHLAAVVEPVEAIEGRWGNAIGIDPAQCVRRAVFAKARPTRVIAGGDGAEVIQDNVEQDVDAAFVGRFGEVAQGGGAAELRADGGEIER